MIQRITVDVAVVEVREGECVVDALGGVDAAVRGSGCVLDSADREGDRCVCRGQYAVAEPVDERICAEEIGVRRVDEAAVLAPLWP